MLRFPAVLSFALWPLVITPAAADVPRVVTDIAPVYSLAAQVMAGVGTPDLMVPADASPHHFALKGSQVRVMSQADVVVWIGPALTAWLEKPISTLAPKATNVVLMDVAGTHHLPLRDAAIFGGHDHDHGHEEGHDGHDDHDGHKDHDDHDGDHSDHEDHAGHEGHEDHDDHAGHDDHVNEAGHEGHDGHKDHDDHAEAEAARDPHLWLDPENAQVWLGHLAQVLAEADPENAATYQRNATEAQQRLAELQTRLTQQLAPVVGKSFVVFHDAYHPFEARFGIAATAALNGGDADRAGAGRVAAVRDALRENPPVCAFSEPQMRRDMMDVVLEGLPSKRGVLDPIGVGLPLDGALYETVLSNMGDAFATCLADYG